MRPINFQEAYNVIRPSVVGLGLRNDPEYQIFGSGFIVHPSGQIMTNQHVIKALLSQGRDGRTGLKKGAAAFLFITTQPSEGFVGVGGMVVTDLIESAYEGASPPTKPDYQKTFRGHKPRQIIPADPLDIGICQIDPRSIIPEALPLASVRIVHSGPVSEGTAIGIIGFPQGLEFPVRFNNQSSMQLTPLLQVGVVAGVLPFSGLPKPNNFVLDVVVNPGSSGSPLFLFNGDVVGIVYATRRNFEPLYTKDQKGEFKKLDDSGVFVPTSLGLAVPSARFPDQWLSTDENDNR